MKKLIVTLTVSLACLGAFAQGKVTFVNNSLHLLYFTADSSQLDPLDAALAGKATLSNAKGGNGATVLLVDLYAGTSSASLSRVATTGISSAALAGTFNQANVSMTPGGLNFNGVTAVPSGVDFFQVQVYDGSMGSYAAAAAAQGKYYGASSIFTSTASGGTPYYNITQLISPAFSTWAIGSQNLDDVVVGGRGAIQIQMNVVPEPTSFALAGLGAAALLIFRRRK